MINNNWVFGDDCGLDFSTAPASPIPTSGFAMSTLEGCSSVSDSSGSLLFYTDGSTVWDKTHTVKVTGLQGNSSSTQSAIIVPDPSNGDQYYIFTADGASGSNNHFNGGLINVVSWSFTPLSSLMTIPSTAGFSAVEKVTAIQHDNCKDYWVITVLQKGAVNSPAGDGTLRVYLVDATGISHSADFPLRQNIVDYGYMKASPDKKRLAIANYGDNSILVYPFDATAGTVNTGGLMVVNTLTTQNYGLEFSPNSNLLYYSDVSTGPVYQVDLTGALTSLAVGTISSTTGALQLGVDGRIYIAKGGQNSLGAILDPDTPGTGCNLNPSYVTLLPGSQCLYGLPNLISGFCPEGCECGCTGCNEEASQQNEELIDRANTKFFTVPSSTNCGKPFDEECEKSAIESQLDLAPCFYFHWGDGANDQIEEHDTEIFYLTVCNKYNDIQYNGLRITKVSLIPNIHPLDKIHIVPDRFINLDCLEPCSCQTREFALITRANDTAGNYTLEVEYCYEGIEIVSAGKSKSGKVTFPVSITED